MKTPLIVLATAALLASAVPQAAPAADASAPGQCFRRSDIRNHSIGDASTLYFKVGRSAVYRVETSGSCLAGASFGDPLVMRSHGLSDRICDPIDLDIRVATGGFETPCIVSAITRLTPAQVAALPRKQRP